MTRHSHLHWLRRGLQELLVSDLAQWPQLEVVSRDALGPVLREQWLQQRGFSSSENSVGLGRLKGVRYLIQGRIYGQGETLAVDLQIVDVETGVVVGSVNSQGVESDIPGLEQDLVTQVIDVFDPSLNGVRPLRAEQREESAQPYFRRYLENEEGKGYGTSSGPVSSHSVPQIDALLALEKLTHQRRKAYWLAETIWHEGWVFEMGEPLYEVWHLSNNSTKSVPVMDIPLSLFFSPRRLSEIIEQVQVTGTDFGGNVDSDGFRAILDEASGAQSLFIKYFQKPRRVFIRARDEKEDVLAIFSDWAWRTEPKILMRDRQGISVPMWPNPFINGFAKFPVEWVEREGQHVTFDVVVGPVPDEQVFVILEPMGEPKGENEISRLGDVDQDDSLIQDLERLIKSNWTPAITEGLPVRGYLPGNKRTAVGVVHVQNGKIRSLQFQHWPEDPFFLQSLQDLQSKLLESCVGCQDSGRVLPPFSGVLQTFRLQLTLVKDMHAFHLGQHSD
ncbi:MAG: hypothetical protein KC592_02250 [Nitrospira sp.]|nr:hypothetical protein [Nitrospira sp.]